MDELLSFIGQADDDVIYHVAPITDPCHSDDVLYSMVGAVYQRNEPDEEDQNQSGEIDRPFMSLELANDSVDPAWGNRSRFDEILSLVPEEDIRHAEKKYMDKYWEFVTRYFKARAVYARQEVELTADLKAFRKKVDQLKRSVEAAEVGKLILFSNAPALSAMSDYAQRSSRKEDTFLTAARLHSESQRLDERKEELDYKLDRYGITGKRALHPLMYCMTLLGEARNQTKHFYDVSDMDSDENDEGSEQDRTSDHDYETELQALRAEVKTLKQQLYETGREVRDEKMRYEALAQKTADDAQELHDLRELVFNQQTELNDEPERPANITFPYRTDRRIVVFGGHDSWAREMKPRFPDIRFIDREMQPNSDMIRRADVVWIQANALAHKHFYRIIDEVRKNGIPLRYFTYAGVNKCSEQLALEDRKNK